VHDDAQWQIAICEAGGGKGSVIDVGRYGDGSVRSMQTKCSGGFFNGVSCWNSICYGVDCWVRKSANSPSVPVDLPLVTYAEGSRLGINASVSALSQVIQPAQVLATDQGETVRPSEQDQAKKHGKGKGKHRGHGKGKKGSERHR
jgi:hypothetical protein